MPTLKRRGLKLETQTKILPVTPQNNKPLSKVFKKVSFHGVHTENEAEESEQRDTNEVVNRPSKKPTGILKKSTSTASPTTYDLDKNSEIAFQNAILNATLGNGVSSTGITPDQYRSYLNAQRQKLMYRKFLMDMHKNSITNLFLSPSRTYNSLVNSYLREKAAYYNGLESLYNPSYNSKYRNQYGYANYYPDQYPQAVSNEYYQNYYRELYLRNLEAQILRYNQAYPMNVAQQYTVNQNRNNVPPTYSSPPNSVYPNVNQTYANSYSPDQSLPSNNNPSYNYNAQNYPPNVNQYYTPAPPPQSPPPPPPTLPPNSYQQFYHYNDYTLSYNTPNNNGVPYFPNLPNSFIPPPHFPTQALYNQAINQEQVFVENSISRNIYEPSEYYESEKSKLEENRVESSEEEQPLKLGPEKHRRERHSNDIRKERKGSKMKFRDEILINKKGCGDEYPTDGMVKTPQKSSRGWGDEYDEDVGSEEEEHFDEPNNTVHKEAWIRHFVQKVTKDLSETNCEKT